MTNIAALKVKADNGSPQEYAVLVADGMGTQVSKTGGDVKDDSHQKLYTLGSHLLMGTGHARHIQGIAEELGRASFASSRDLTDTAAKYLGNVPLEERPHFIIAGRDGVQEGGVGIYHLVTNDESKDPHTQIVIHRCNDAFDGSESPHAIGYAQGLEKAGRPIYVDDLADGLVLAHEFGKEGARSSGVNDRLQYGIVAGDGKVVTLYHPGIMLDSQEAFIEHIHRMTGIELQGLDHTQFSPKILQEVRDEQERRRVVGGVMRGVYTAFSADLNDLSRARTLFTGDAESWATDRIEVEELRASKERRAEAKAQVMKGADALMKRNLEALLAYRKDAAGREEALQEKAISYLPPKTADAGGGSV